MSKQLKAMVSRRETMCAEEAEITARELRTALAKLTQIIKVWPDATELEAHIYTYWWNCDEIRKTRKWLRRFEKVHARNFPESRNVDESHWAEDCK